MCGIIGYTGSRPAAPLLVEGLRRLEYRGYDSAGVALIDPSRTPTMLLSRSEGKIAALAAKLDAEPLSGTLGVGHTRWATHGRPCEANAHPQRAGKVCVVHNGIIENYQHHRDALIARGRTFTSDTDTEVVAHLVDEHYQGDLHAAVRAAIKLIEGAYALVVIHDDHPTQLVAARHASPLLIGLGGEQGEPGPDGSRWPDESFVASDVSAILQHTRMIVDLDDGDTALVEDVVMILLDEWCGQWKAVQELRPQFIGHENSGQFLQTSARDAVIVAMTLECSFGDCTEQIQLGVPYFTIEPLVKKLAALHQRDTAEVQTAKRAEWQPSYDRITVPVRAEWDAFEVTLREVTQLRVGDVIEVRPSVCTETRILMNGTPKFIGTVGLDTDRVAVQISRKIPSEENFNAQSDGRKVS